MHNPQQGKVSESDATPKLTSPHRWVVILSALSISLLLWGAIILIGKEMFRRLNAEIAKGAVAFQSTE